MLFGLLVGPVQQLLAAEGGGGLPRQLLLLVLVHAELPHEELVLPESGQSEVAPAEGALGMLLPGHGVDALLAGGVVAGADDQGALSLVLKQTLQISQTMFSSLLTCPSGECPSTLPQPIILFIVIISKYRLDKGAERNY